MPDKSTASEPSTIGTCDTAGPIEVESSGGETVPTPYATLSDAFANINAGTHTGSIKIEVCGNTAEPPAGAVLNASGGPSFYTDVTVRPVGGGRVIEGATSASTALIKLNSADNVTIDGRQGGTGNARDLTVRNTSTGSSTAAIWLSSGSSSNGASNNVIRNLEVACGLDASGSSVFTVGIIMSGASISLTNTGIDNDNNQFISNRILKVRYGIVTRGLDTNLSVSPIITDNVIGPNAFGSDQIGKAGMLLQHDDGAVVSRNTIQFVGCLTSQTCAAADRIGIAIGSDNWGVADLATGGSVGDGRGYSVTRNVIHNIVEEKRASSVGIKLATTQSGGATNNVVANNLIYNLRSNGNSGEQVAGIGISGGNGDKVVFNSISLTGDMDPGTPNSSAQFGSAIRISSANGANNANFLIQNNSIYLDATSDDPLVKYYAITLPSASYSFGTGSLNNNNYYINQANAQLRTAGFATAAGKAAASEFQTLADWKSALTVVQDANSIQSDPLYVSNASNLRLSPSSPNINAGAAVSGISDDVDAQGRPYGGLFDIGADEVVPSAAGVSIGGRVVNSFGQGIRGVSITLEGDSLADPLTIQTGPFGYYRFDGIMAGHSYVVSVRAKRYVFDEAMRVVNLDDVMLDVNFLASDRMLR